ncbi:MAG: ATP-binding protein, partial [Lachnospiraceae bacterium]|nr:ATP-binding protein [Lachnospiraceae bacterium]
QIKKRMESLCKEKGVTLTCSRNVDTIYANEVLLFSLLCNLIQNAVYACERGDIVAWGVEEEGENLRIYVEDNGCGMTKEQVKRVREPFYRVDKARSREAGRTGLGLALCSQIVEYHNARMEIQSEIDKGTIITILFPKKFTV